MSQQSDMAEAAYERIKKEPLPISSLVREIREKWGGGFDVSAVHGFVREVATCLLRHDDLAVGDLVDGRFRAWGFEPWKADEKIDGELMSMSAFFSDDTHCVFEMKTRPIKALEATLVPAATIRQVTPRSHPQRGVPQR